MSHGTEPLRPPRLSGDPQSDYPALIEYLWSFWRAVTANFVNVADVGETVQPTTQMLSALAPLVPAADKLPYTTSTSAAALTDFTAFARTILDDADAVTVRATLGLGALAQLNTVSTSYIDNDAVTYDKLQNLTTTGVLLGRQSAGAGNVEEILFGNLDHATLGNLNSATYTHLTSTEYAGSGTGVFARVTSPVFTTPNIGSATGSVSGTAANVTGIVAIANGGTGQDTAQEAIDALSQVSAATNEYVLTKDTATGNALWKVATSGSHAGLANLAWTSSGHTGTATRIAGFDGSGVASEYTMSGTGTQLALTTSPVFVTPDLGTPSSGTLTNCTGLPQAGTVGLTTADSPQFAGINIGHASDTTLTRVLAGTIAVEGVNLLTTSTGAAIAGNAAQVFSVAAASSAAHAVRYDQTAQSCAFLAYLTSTLTDVTGDNTTVTLTGFTEIIDRGTNFDTTTGVFTAPVTGAYRFTAQARIIGITTMDVAEIIIVTSNRSYTHSTAYTTLALTAMSLNMSCLADMDAGDTAYVTVRASGTTKIADIQGGSPLTFFCGELV